MEMSRVLFVILFMGDTVKMHEYLQEPLHPQRQLLETLMNNYNSRVRPVFHPEEHLQVNVTISVGL